MKKRAFLASLVVLALAVGAIPVWAQLGTVDWSSFTVQNVGTGPATVVITFYTEDGTAHTPNPLNGGQPNPFTLNPGDSFEVYLPGIPGLADGRYSVVISSDQKVVAIANLIGRTGEIFYNGSYSGVSTGDRIVYLPAIVYDFYTWNSLISIQNIGTGPTDITVDYICIGGGTGRHTKTALAANAAVHFDLETNPPPGLPRGCNGSAVITSSAQPVIVVDNQTAAGGFTQSFNGFITGTHTVYVPALYHDYYTWHASLNIVKIGAGNATVTVTYSDGGTSTCNLTDASPSCLLYMPAVHPRKGMFAATITSVGQPVVAIANAANAARQAQTYGGFAGGARTVGLPTTMKQYYGWDTSFTCQNVGTVPTTLNISYQGYAANAYNTRSLNPGGSVEVYQPGEGFLPNGFRGSVTVTANAADARIACIVNLTHPANQAAGKGDWSMSYNAQ